MQRPLSPSLAFDLLDVRHADDPANARPDERQWSHAVAVAARQDQGRLAWAAPLLGMAVFGALPSAIALWAVLG